MRKKNISFELRLSHVIKIHNLFHLNYLQKTFTNLLMSQVNKLVPTIIINNKDK